MGETEKLVHHLEVALRIAYSFDWHRLLFWAHYRLSGPFYDECRFDDANTHIERTKSHCAMGARAQIWYK